MKKPNFEVLIKTATDKYSQLLDKAYNLRDDKGSDEFKTFINLIHGTYLDEVMLIFQLCEHSNNEKEVEELLDLPEFIKKK